MSRAFVKEDAGAETLPERPVSPLRNLVTRRGLALIDREIEALRAALAAATGAGDRDAIARVSRDLRYWTSRRASAEPVDPSAEGAKITIGMAVTIEDGQGRRRSYRIVGEDEADPKVGRIAWSAPVARALLGRELGDEVDMPFGTAEIVEIDARPEPLPA
ncbi:GreA/GreB family elongation factor [Ancylobacter sp. 6x-1]|uniref:GreA/GreB family elongation factor n=1 Tax=Ancylobacter crimeensis TaxID=2579147 RepID=A0ABT0D6F5_9HYPH|nr:GreA/GreB family elongation factor [Ancylobacter crimeensis]MCK0195498.1 GreA/GreB family elongation factor [Ancylobacter crimeensis]